MDTDSDLGYMFQHVAAQMAKQADQVLQEQLGIGHAQYKLLRELQDRPYMKQKDIARSLGQTEASISRQVKLMITQGLVHITRNPRNRREHLTQVTVKGLKLTEAAHQALAAFHAPIFAGLSDKQQDRAAEIFDALHAKICSLEHSVAA